MKILVRDILDFQESTHSNTIKKFKLDEKIVLEDYQIPSNVIRRIINSVFLLLLNFSRIRKLKAYYINKRKFSLTWIFQFNFFKKFEEVDVFHVQYGTNVHPVDLLKKIQLLKGKLIVSFHGHDAFFPINGWIKERGYYDDLFFSGDAIIANTPYLASQLLNIGCPEEKLRCIPVGFDKNVFNSDQKLEKNDQMIRLVNVGRLDKVKGHIYSIKAIEKLKAEGYNVCLTIIGEGNQRKILENDVKNKNLEEQVFLVGKKGQEEVKEYLLSSDIYILSAVSVENGRRETQGLATIEAQACGLPVVVFDSGGVKYTVNQQQTGFIVPEYDVMELVEKVKILIDNPDLRKTMGKEASEFAVQKFSQQRLDPVWQKIYNDEEK